MEYRRKPFLDREEEKVPSIIYSIPKKNAGFFNDLDETQSQILNTDRFCYRGLKLSFVNILQRDYNFRVTHSFELGKKQGQLQNGKKDGQKSAYSLAVLVVGKEWMTQIQRVQNQSTGFHTEYKNGNFEAAFVGQIQRGVGSQLNINAGYKFKDMCFEAKINSQLVAELSMTQPITEKLAAGALISFSPANDKAQLKLTGKYTEEDIKSETLVSVTTGGGSDELHLSYMQEIWNNLNFIAAVDTSLAKKSPLGGEKEWGSVVKGGYSYNMRQFGIQTQGLFDSSGNVACVATSSIAQDVNLTLSGNMNYKRNTYDFGFGIQLPV